jgi:hypothetical protein
MQSPLFYQKISYTSILVPKYPFPKQRFRNCKYSASRAKNKINPFIFYGQLIKSLDRNKIVEISRKHGGERYVKSFDGFTHLATMLYAVTMRFDSLREIETSMAVEVRKLHHVGIETVPKRSTQSDANFMRVLLN